MRLWSFHPLYLDRAGLVACWREGLLVRRVLGGPTKGYRHHPQLARFGAAPDPLAAVDAYLAVVWEEADRRGYRFERSKLDALRPVGRIPLSDGQLLYEFDHFKRKLERRAPERLEALRSVELPRAHPLFTLHHGGLEPWEKGAGASR